MAEPVAVAVAALIGLLIGWRAGRRARGRRLELSLTIRGDDGPGAAIPARRRRRGLGSPAIGDGARESHDQ